MAHRIAERAEADLDDIWCYVAKESGNLDVASRLIDLIVGRFILLGTFPYAGRERTRNFGTEMRSFRWVTTLSSIALTAMMF
jgi:plasmid stabilization system protein ParE